MSLLTLRSVRSEVDPCSIWSIDGCGWTLAASHLQIATWVSKCMLAKSTTQSRSIMPPAGCRSYRRNAVAYARSDDPRSEHASFSCLQKTGCFLVGSRSHHIATRAGMERARRGQCDGSHRDRVRIRALAGTHPVWVEPAFREQLRAHAFAPLYRNAWAIQRTVSCAIRDALRRRCLQSSSSSGDGAATDARGGVRPLETDSRRGHVQKVLPLSA